METRVNIPKPCPADWERMKIGLHSRFCDNCEKNVIDFTHKDRKEILEYLLANYDKRVCGHIFPYQLDFTNTDFLITINALNKKSNNPNLSFYLLTLGTLILAGCDNPEIGNKSKGVDTIASAPKNIDTTTTTQYLDTSRKSFINPKKEMPPIPIGAIEGEIFVGPDTTFGHAEPYPYVEIMPEFKGGMDSLLSFINLNLKYPDWEKENKIEGKVFVNFVVDKNGKIKNAKILKTVKGSKNFDIEVLRVINNMPDWIPGQQDGKNVDVQFNLPINFKL